MLLRPPFSRLLVEHPEIPVAGPKGSSTRRAAQSTACTETTCCCPAVHSDGENFNPTVGRPEDAVDAGI